MSTLSLWMWRHSGLNPIEEKIKGKITKSAMENPSQTLQELEKWSQKNDTKSWKKNV